MIKSKRLKNFCQVCRKQCKDENGYHCHLNSGHHQKRLRQLATNPQEHIQKYSNQLQSKIVQILKTKYPGEPRDLEDIYEEYSEQKHHVKFNFTKWKDLQQFSQHLKTNVRNLKVTGKLPYCNVTYVVSKAGDFLQKKRQQQTLKKKEKEKQLEQKRMEERIVRMRETQVQRYKEHKQKMKMKDESQQQVDLAQIRIDLNEKKFQPSKLFLQEEKTQKQQIKNPKIKQSNIEKLLGQIENKQRIKTNQNIKKSNQPIQQEYEWILPGIVVKIKPHEIPQVFHDKKASIQKISQPYMAQIKLGSAILNIDQSYLETVIPKIGNQVKLLKGKYRNLNGILKQVDILNGIGSIELQQLQNNEKKTVRVPFNEFSKMVQV